MTNCFTWKLIGYFNWIFFKTFIKLLMAPSYCVHSTWISLSKLLFLWRSISVVWFIGIFNWLFLMTPCFQHVLFAFIRIISILCWNLLVMESPWVEWLYINLKDSFLFGKSLWKSNTIHNSRNIKNRMRSLVVFKCWNDMKQLLICLACGAYFYWIFFQLQVSSTKI